MMFHSVLFGPLLFKTPYHLFAKGKLAGAHKYSFFSPLTRIHVIRAMTYRSIISRLPPGIRSSLLWIYPALQCNQSRWSFHLIRVFVHASERFILCSIINLPMGHVDIFTTTGAMITVDSCNIRWHLLKTFINYIKMKCCESLSQ